jgi:hypothetical protein
MISLLWYYLHKKRGIPLERAGVMAVPMGMAGDIVLAWTIAQMLR